ncbi:MAG: nuclear transport factor 2 family protein [Flavobacteriaceae bacterium]|jgi:hypothetical protein|nr:nuclear transport factor 2 family protein [Flavobacteriaceae bacterium]
MRKTLVTTLILLSQFVIAQTQKDSLQVKETVRKYIESFYLTQPEKGQESIHPLLAKRTIQEFADGSEFLKGMSFEEMNNLGKVFNAKGKYNKDSKKEIIILDMMDKTASVKLIAEGWVDYMHLGKINGKWKIINILWQISNK